MTLEEFYDQVQDLYLTTKDDKASVECLQRPSNQWKVKSIFYDKESNTILIEI